jgi:hypothetical protein
MEPFAPEDGFDEPDPDDADTGPLNVSAASPYVESTWDAGANTDYLPEGGLPGDARLYTPDDGGSSRHFEPLTVTPLPVRRQRKPVLLVGAVAAAVVVVGGLAFWLLRPSPATPSSPTASPTTSATADAEAQTRLSRLLPPGYPPDSCKPVAPLKDGLAQVNCVKNADPGGPQSATYTLAKDKASLEGAFNDIVAASTTEICPGNIQSPGPWRRNATPDKISGVLFCGVHEGRPMVAWTDDARLLLSAVQAGPQGPTFPQLYAWWSSHS